MRNIERIVEKMRLAKKIIAAVFALGILMTGCGKQETGDQIVTTAATPAFSVTSAGETLADAEADPEDTVSIYTGKTVENEADLAIYKFNSTLPDGYETKIDNSEGKMYASPNGSIIVKAQNYKEEFQELSVFADQGCASIKLNNMMYQADTNFSDPQNTTVAGFDAIRYDYTVTAYIYEYETDSAGAQVTGDDGNPIITDQKDVLGEYVNRVYYFYSDEDVFYVICESRKENSEAAAKEFDEFISGVTITKK